MTPPKSCRLQDPNYAIIGYVETFMKMYTLSFRKKKDKSQRLDSWDPSSNNFGAGTVEAIRLNCLDHQVMSCMYKKKENCTHFLCIRRLRTIVPQNRLTRTMVNIMSKYLMWISQCWSSYFGDRWRNGNITCTECINSCIIWYNWKKLTRVQNYVKVVKWKISRKAYLAWPGTIWFFRR